MVPVCAASFHELNGVMARLDILINNTGVLRPTRGQDIAEEEWDYVIENNLKNTFLCCRSAIAAVDTYALSFPMRRLGMPGEVADLVVFLASPLSSYITGASIDINGGDLTIWCGLMGRVDHPSSSKCARACESASRLGTDRRGLQDP